MKIYIEQTANDKAEIIDFGELSEAPANSELVEIGDGFADHFRNYKHIQIINNAGRWAGMTEYALFDDTDERYIAHNGDHLVYYKSIGTVTWANNTMPSSLEITTDAVDSYSPYDGVPDIPADGTSTCTITVKKLDYKGDVDTSDSTNNIVLTTERGNLDSLKNTLVNGEVSFTLTSVQETCKTWVEAEVDGVDSIFPVGILIQFAPVS